MSKTFRFNKQAGGYTTKARGKNEKSFSDKREALRVGVKRTLHVRRNRNPIDTEEYNE